MSKSFKCRVWVLLVVALLGWSAWVPAQEAAAAEEVKKLQEHFAAELSILAQNKPLAILQDKYRGHLAKQKADYQAAGQLEEMLAVDAELKALTSGSDASSIVPC